MNRILRAVMIISLITIPLQTGVQFPVGRSGDAVGRTNWQAIKPERAESVCAQQREQGFLAALRQVLNLNRRSIAQSSQNHIPPTSPNSIQPPVILIPSAPPASFKHNQLPARVIEIPSAPPASSPAPSKPTEQQNKECAICLSDIEADQAPQALQCAHLFHAACINPWLARSNTCPECRMNVPVSRQ